MIIYDYQYLCYPILVQIFSYLKIGFSALRKLQIEIRITQRNSNIIEKMAAFL